MDGEVGAISSPEGGRKDWKNLREDAQQCASECMELRVRLTQGFSSNPAEVLYRTDRRKQLILRLRILENHRDAGHTLAMEPIPYTNFDSHENGL